jgi:hypothetical protein
MAREDLTAASRNAFILATPGVNGYRFSRRTTAGGSSWTDGSGAVSYPNTWLRLQRVGSTFIGFRSTDGVNWAEVGRQDLTGMPSTVYFGMALTSHYDGQSATAKFRDLADV